MTSIDWSRPLVTNAGKVARVTERDSDRDYVVHWDDDWGVFKPTGKSWLNCIATFIRNATPSEILANPEAWPDWQAWARGQMHDAGNALLGKVLDAAANIAPAQPEPGVMVTRQALLQAMADLRMGMTNEEVFALADALGLPPQPPKVAPWEEAYEAWIKQAGGDWTLKGIWQAGVMFAVGQIEAQRAARFAASKHVAEILVRIMGEQA